MEPSVNCIKKWLVTTEHHQTPFPSLELSFWTQRTKSEDQNLTCTEKTDLDSQFLELPTEPVKENTEPFLKLTDQILSSNDVAQYLIIKIVFLSFLTSWKYFFQISTKIFQLYYDKIYINKYHFEINIIFLMVISTNNVFFCKKKKIENAS